MCSSTTYDLDYIQPLGPRIPRRKKEKKKGGKRFETSRLPKGFNRLKQNAEHVRSFLYQFEFFFSFLRLKILITVRHIKGNPSPLRSKTIMAKDKYAFRRRLRRGHGVGMHRPPMRKFKPQSLTPMTPCRLHWLTPLADSGYDTSRKRSKSHHGYAQTTYIHKAIGKLHQGRGRRR